VIRRNGDSLFVEGALTLGTVSEVAGAAREHLRQGARVVDFGGVTEVDSAAIALALEWLRQAAEDEGKPGLRYANLPLAMQNLAKLYGVSELLQPAST
jgi:phospholipid transport system transporter-binding protein